MHAIRVFLTLLLLLMLIPLQMSVASMAKNQENPSGSDIEYLNANMGTGEAIIDKNPDLAVNYVSSVQWNTIFDIAKQGDYGYCAMPYGLKILDLSDIYNPVEISSLYIGPNGRSVEIIVEGSYAYLSCGYFGTAIVDISDPYSPYLTGSYPGSGWHSSLLLQENYLGSDDYAFLSCQFFGLDVLNITDRSNPLQVGSYQYVPELGGGDPVPVHLFKWETNYLFLTDYYNGLITFDIFDPTNPDSLTNFRDMASSNRYYNAITRNDYPTSIYQGAVGNGGDRYGFYEGFIANPATPNPIIPLASGLNYHALYNIEMVGDYVYGASGSNGFVQIYPIVPVNPSNEILDFPAYDFCSESLNENETRFYVTSSNEGLNIVDYSEPSDLFTHQSNYPFSDLNLGVCVNGQYLYICNEDEGLNIYDISDPYVPVHVGNYDTPGMADGVTVKGKYAYVCDGDAFLVIDISNPTNPIQVGSVNESAVRAYIEGNYAYIVQNVFGEDFIVVDISDPTNPIPVGTTNIGYSTGNLAVKDNYAYCSIFSNGVSIVDISTPGTPSHVYNYDETSFNHIMSLDISGSYMYLADQNYLLWIIDISDPMLPAVSGTYIFTDAFMPEHVSIYGTYAVVSGEGGIRIVDVSNPTSPSLSGSYNSTGASSSMITEADVQGNFIYMTDIFGLLILHSDMCQYNAGDVDNDSDIDIDDINYLDAYLTGSGPAPPITANCDANGDCCLDHNDILQLYEYLYWNGEYPYNCNCPDPLTCTMEDYFVIRAEAEPSYTGNTVYVNEPFNIGLYMNHFSTEDVNRLGMSIPLKFYSPDNSITSVIHNDIGGYGPFNSIEELNGFDEDDENEFWEMLNQFETSEFDGYLPDVINYTIAGSAGLPSGLGDQLYFQFNLTIEQEGIICLDSCDYLNDTYDWLFEAPSPDFHGPYCWNVVESPFICDCTPGDANGVEPINLLDVTYLIGYLYNGGPPPIPYETCSGDTNGNCTVNLLDITALIGYLYLEQAPPVSCDDWAGNCEVPLWK